MDIISIIIIAVILLIIVGLVLYAVGIYNKFFNLKNSAEATLGQIRVAMKKRLDMIEQLLGSVKSYAAFEKGTLEQVTALRSSVLKASPGELNAIEQQSRSLLGSLYAVAENYPDLKTSTTVQTLMGSIKEIEDEIARQRYTYNNIAQQLNTMTDTIPSNFVGRMIGMQKLEYLQFEDAIEKAPKIEF